MIVIADDITGAAEMAGIAFSHGQQVRLVCSGEGCGCGTATNETVIIATDTRSMSEAEAVAETRRIVTQTSNLKSLRNATLSRRETSNHKSQIFKKTDSTLRGHVVAELTALMEATGYQRAVYLPANPSKGRIIRNGIYYMNNVPIHETAFSYDPEYPALTSVLRERFPDAESKGIIMPDAESEDGIRRVVAAYNDGKTLFAGAADLFSAWLYAALSSHSSFHIPHSSFHIPHSSSLILCGSTQSKALDLGIPIAPMPREVYDGSEDISLWNTHEYSKGHSLILTIPHTHRTGKEAAVHLRTMMAQKAKELITQHCPDHLIIEGGATAWATLQTLGWTEFSITAQIAPGVVQMSATIACHTSTCGSKKRVMVTLKPGSYPWGNLFATCANR